MGSLQVNHPVRGFCLCQHPGRPTCLNVHFSITVLTNEIESSNLQGWHTGTLIGCEPAIADRTGNDGHFLETLFEVWARARLGPRNTSTKTACGMKYKKTNESAYIHTWHGVN